MPYLLKRAPMLERAPALEVEPRFWHEIFNERLPRMSVPFFLSKGVLIWKIEFKGGAHLGIT